MTAPVSIIKWTTVTMFYKSYVALATLEKATAPESYCFPSLNTHDKGILLTYLYLSSSIKRRILEHPPIWHYMTSSSHHLVPGSTGFGTT